MDLRSCLKSFFVETNSSLNNAFVLFNFIKLLLCNNVTIHVAQSLNMFINMTNLYFTIHLNLQEYVCFISKIVNRSADFIKKIDR